MANIIRFVLGNFTLTFLVIGLIASGVALLRKPKPLTTPVVVEALFAYFLLFSIGFSLLYNFVLHSFLGQMTAGFIGWANSPFQKEVGFASLGYSVVGFLAFRRSFDLRLAAVTGPALFLFCADSCNWFCVAVAAAPIPDEISASGNRESAGTHEALVEPALKRVMLRGDSFTER
jgi:hypothetical protein